MNVEEARNIVEEFKQPGRYLSASGGALNEYHEAKGYLAALSGEEFKALTTRIEEMKGEIKRLRSLCAGSLASMIRESWQPGPSETEIHHDLWCYLDSDEFPLSREGITDDSRIEYLVKLYEGKI